MIVFAEEEYYAVIFGDTGSIEDECRLALTDVDYREFRDRTIYETKLMVK